MIALLRAINAMRNGWINVNDQVGKTASWAYVKKKPLPYKVGKFMSCLACDVKLIWSAFINGIKEGYKEANKR